MLLSNESRERLPVLDGLRFFAAFTVMMAHYTSMIVCDQGVQNKLTTLFMTFSGIGMPLFFVLSGFVIHYNYRQLHQQAGGLKKFFVARFSRLYPLYILLAVIEFIVAFKCKRGSCSIAGDKWGLLLAVPYYLTLTQDWFYGVIGTNNLIYQYHTMVTAVAWSISLEIFFYLFYLFFANWAGRQKFVVKQLLWMAFAQIFVIACVLFLSRHEAKIDHIALIAFGEKATLQTGYQDSLLRWLYYFNPLINLPSFIIGVLTANLYLCLKDKPLNIFERKCGGWLTLCSIVGLCTSHYLFFFTGVLWMGRTGGVLLVPMVAIMIFCLTRYTKSICTQVISHPFLVKLGEASYSIYLLHAFFGWYPRDFYYLGLNPWLLFSLAMVCILAISRLNYMLFEKPVQRWLRNRLLGKAPTKNEIYINMQTQHSAYP